jgi:hypothetical protein
VHFEGGLAAIRQLALPEAASWSLCSRFKLPAELPLLGNRRLPPSPLSQYACGQAEGFRIPVLLVSLPLVAFESGNISETLSL